MIREISNEGKSNEDEVCYTRFDIERREFAGVGTQKTEDRFQVEPEKCEWLFFAKNV